MSNNRKSCGNWRDRRFLKINEGMVNQCCTNTRSFNKCYVCILLNTSLKLEPVMLSSKTLQYMFVRLNKIKAH